MQDDLLNQIRNFMQNLYDGPPGVDKEHEATMDTKLPSTKEIQPLPVQEPPQDSDICQLIRKECCVEASEEQKVVHKSSIPFKNTSQISSIHAVAPVLSTKKPKHLLNIGYEYLSITLETESDEVTESNAENLLPIPSECEVALEDKRECDVPISKNSFVCDNSDTFSDSKIDDDISVYDDDFEDIEYVEASLFDPEIVSVEEENVVQHEEENIKPDQERLINLVENDILDDSTSDPLLEATDLFLAVDHLIPPGEEIPVVMNDKDEDVYSSFIFVIFVKMFSLLSAKSDDTIFDHGIFD
nr:hypothetical protein [Tanacetum cinerariifolium]